MIEMDKIESGQFHCMAKIKKSIEQLELKLNKIAESNILSEQWLKILSNVISSSTKLLTAIEQLRGSSTVSPPHSPRYNVPKEVK